MNQLKIDELSFCEDVILHSNSLVGGDLFYSTGYDAKSAWDYLSGYLTYYSVGKIGYTYFLGGSINGATAGAIAAGVAVGGVPVATFATSTIVAVG